MPRQLKNDLYRVSSKEVQQKEPFLPKSERQQNEIPLDAKVMIRNNSYSQKNKNLRDIIKKKLSQNVEKENVVAPKMKTNDQVKESSSNRYKQLLSQFYGEPTDFKSKDKKAPTD